MANSASRSGRDVGAEYVRRVRHYIESHPVLPVRNGALDMSALAAATGVPRQSLYKNPSIRELLDEKRTREQLCTEDNADNVASNPALGESLDQTRQGKFEQMERRISGLERQNIALHVENSELRRQVNDLRLAIGRYDLMLETGRRIPSPRDLE